MAPASLGWQAAKFRIPCSACSNNCLFINLVKVGRYGRFTLAISVICVDRHHHGKHCRTSFELAPLHLRIDRDIYGPANQWALCLALSVGNLHRGHAAMIEAARHCQFGSGIDPVKLTGDDRPV